MYAHGSECLEASSPIDKTLPICVYACVCVCVVNLKRTKDGENKKVASSVRERDTKYIHNKHTFFLLLVKP